MLSPPVFESFFHSLSQVRIDGIALQVLYLLFVDDCFRSLRLYRNVLKFEKLLDNKALSVSENDAKGAWLIHVSWHVRLPQACLCLSHSPQGSTLILANKIRLSSECSFCYFRHNCFHFTQISYFFSVNLFKDLFYKLPHCITLHCIDNDVFSEPSCTWNSW